MAAADELSPRAMRLRAFRRGVHGPRVFGHRGVRGDGAPPENTRAAFERAAEAGADGIELDARLSADGVLIALHDPTLERVTGGADARLVADLTWPELAGLDLGSASPASVADVLAFARPRRLAVNVEMKRDVPDRLAVVRATARLLSGWAPRHAVLVSSFDPPMLVAFGALAPHVPRALLIHRSWYTEAALRAASAFEAAHVERTIASPAVVRRLRARGLVVQVWTVNHAIEATDLDAVGADGFITDRPAEIREALAANVAMRA